MTDEGGDCHTRQRPLYLKVSTGGEVKKEGGEMCSRVVCLSDCGLQTCHLHAHTLASARIRTHTQRQFVIYVLYHNHTSVSAGVLAVLRVASSLYDSSLYDVVPTLWSDGGWVLFIFTRMFRGCHPLTLGCNPQVSKRPT